MFIVFSALIYTDVAMTPVGSVHQGFGDHIHLTAPDIRTDQTIDV